MPWAKLNEDAETADDCIVYIDCTDFSSDCAVYEIDCTVYEIDCAVYKIDCADFASDCAVFEIDCANSLIDAGGVDNFYNIAFLPTDDANIGG